MEKDKTNKAINDNIKRYKEIIKEYQKKLDKIGVDGYLLDTLDTYSYFENKKSKK